VVWNEIQQKIALDQINEKPAVSGCKDVAEFEQFTAAVAYDEEKFHDQPPRTGFF